MTSGVLGAGSTLTGVAQIQGAPGSSVRVMARLYDPDSALLIAANVTDWSLYVFDLSFMDVAVASLVEQVPSSTVFGATLDTTAKWTKDSTGFIFSHLLPPGIASLLTHGKAYLLRYVFSTPTYGKLRFEEVMAC